MLRPFMHLKNAFDDYWKVKEDFFTESCKKNYAEMVMCDTAEYNRRENSGMLFGTIPCQIANYTVEFKKKYGGFPKFCFGRYYRLHNLYLLTDVMEYNHSFLKFDEIRTAEDIIKKRKRRSHKKP